MGWGIVLNLKVRETKSQKERDHIMRIFSNQKLLATAIAAGLTIMTMTASAQETNSTPQLPYGASEIIKLAKAKISDDTIIAFVKSTRANYSLNADQILYLRQEGASESVITAMLSQAPGSTVPAPVPAPRPSSQATVSVASTATAVVAPPPVTYVQTPAPYYYGYGSPYYYPYYDYGYYGWPFPGVALSFGWGGHWGGGWHGGRR
jgi:hypothetical protein